MTSLPKPKKPKTHSNSKIARRDLEKWLPDDWNFTKNEDDDDSGYEWGEDWKIEIVEDEVASGAFFSIQSKVLNGTKVINSNGIGTEINVTTINRLFDIPYPVLIHFVYPKIGTSYVIWLDDWMAQQSDLSWRVKNNGTVTLRIPKLPENELNSSKIEQIKYHVMRTSFMHGSDKIIDLINRTSKDHRIDVIETEKGTTLIINALHDGALPNITLLDDDAIQSGEKMLDTGLPTPITGEFAFSNIPPLLAQQMKNLTMTGIVASMTVENKRPFVLSIKILSKKRKPLYKIAQINMQMVQQGRKIIKWNGISQVDGIILSLDAFPEKPGQFNLHFDMTQDNDTPIIALNRLKFLQALQQGKLVDLHELTLDLPFGETAIRNLQVNNMSETLPSFEMELAEILVEIWHRLRIMIGLPESYNDRDIATARIIKQILNFGRVNALIDLPESYSGTGQMLMNPSLVPDMISKFEADWKKGEECSIFKTIPTPRLDLFGHKIVLGKRSIVFHIVSINKVSDQFVILASGEEAMQLQFSFDRTKSFTVYEDWCSTDDKITYFPTTEK